MKTDALRIYGEKTRVNVNGNMRVFAVGGTGDNAVSVRAFDGNASGKACEYVYLSGLLDEDVLESFCDFAVAEKPKAIVRTAYDLEETGIIEARYKLSPVMLLHRLGVLEYCTIAGGVCLDNDDLDLMAQENVPLIVLPTADAGYGYGFAPVCAALKRGVRVGVGTFDGKYNKARDIEKEAEFLMLTANAEMRTENALTPEQLKRILEFD